jgi:hypothetical protein
MFPSVNANAEAELVTLCSDAHLTPAMRNLRCFGIFLVLGTLAAAQVPKPKPVLVELFTSEGCSDCPPADALLAKLDQTQPVAGAQIIVLSEHVDYWDRLGWKDPFSSALLTRRQEDYGQRFGLNSVYTPQMVVNGETAFVGSDEKRAQKEIENALASSPVELRISNLQRDGKTLSFTLDAGALAKGDADAYVALAQPHATSQVRDGENSGRTLSYISVVRLLTPVAELRHGKPLDKKVHVDLGALAQQNDLRMIIFVQERGTGHVLGAVTKELAPQISASIQH